MKRTIVDRLYNQFGEIVDQMGDTEITLRLTAEENFRKGLLLASASYFENRITETLLGMVSNATNNNLTVDEFFRNKAISRQYHTYFQWESSNANSFFGLFGEGFKLHMKEKTRNSAELSNSIKAFLEVGLERNRLVHQNYATFTLEKDTDEIYALYTSARFFVEEFPALVQQYNENVVENEGA